MDVYQKIHDLLSQEEHTLQNDENVIYFPPHPDSDTEDLTLEQQVSKVIELFSACTIPISERTFEEEEKLEYMLEMCTRLEALDEMKTFQEKIHFLEEILSKLDLDEVVLTQCARLINDYVEYPYHEEKQSDKYNFIHRGLKCKVYRTSEAWKGYVETDVPLDTESVDYIENPLFDVHGGIISCGVKHLALSCDHDEDVSSISQLIQSFFGLAPSSLVYRDYDFVCEQTRKLADLIRQHVSPLQEVSAV